MFKGLIVASYVEEMSLLNEEDCCYFNLHNPYWLHGNYVLYLILYNNYDIIHNYHLASKSSVGGYISSVLH